MIAAYCQVWARWVEAEQKASQYGLIITTKSGYPMQNPYIAVARRAMDQMRRLAGELGLTPSSRTRLTPAMPPDEKDPLLRIIANKPPPIPIGGRPDMKKALALAKVRDAREVKKAKAREAKSKKRKTKKSKKRKRKAAGRRRGVAADPGARGTDGAPSRADVAEGTGGGVEPPGLETTKPEVEEK